MKTKAANIITFSRILFSIALLHSEPFSPLFYVLYLLCGISDMIDGPVARKTNSADDFGSKLDTCADICFVCAVFYRLFCFIDIDNRLWLWVSAVAAIKVMNIIFSLIARKMFPSVHSILNKATGLMLFAFMPLMRVINNNIAAVCICSVATIAAMQETYLCIKNFKR